MYVCYTNYTLNSPENEIRYCTVQREWSGRDPMCGNVAVISYITSGVLEHKWRASLKLHYCYSNY